jgi:hypothetical protein
MLAAAQVSAFPQSLNAWEERYGAGSDSGANAECQLCHVEVNGGDPWNGYGWDIRDALEDDDCDLNGNGVVSNDEAFWCVELLNSDGNTDGDGNPIDNVFEIGVSTQPGWTDGAANTFYFKSGLTSTGNPPPAGIGANAYATPSWCAPATRSRQPSTGRIPAPGSSSWPASIPNSRTRPMA